MEIGISNGLNSDYYLLAELLLLLLMLLINFQSAIKKVLNCQLKLESQRVYKSLISANCSRSSMAELKNLSLIKYAAKDQFRRVA